MKKKLRIGSASPHAIKKALLVMKLTFLLIFIASLQVSAKVNGQARISLKLNQVEISKALNSIENQGVYRFLYNSRLSDVRKKITINVTDSEISDVLKDLFAGTDLTYRMLENNLIVVLSNALTVQDIRITGKITGENGEPLSGVSVSLKGTTIGTTTDNNGNFTMTVPEKGRLVVSYVGYNTVEVAVNSQSVINVKMVSSTRVMDQVVVIGYGTASKRDLTGSIVKVDGKEVADKPNTNPVASLQGKVAGMTVINNGTPGKQPDIRIRGTASIGQVHPLYVVDGIFNDNIDYINPNDIESIEVLKDPSSLAIFGVKGATGVIAITTKKAKAGQTVINFNTTYGFKKLVDKIKVTNASEFSTLFAEENSNNGVPTPDYSKFNSNTDWIDAVTQTGNYSATNISVSGSTERNRLNLGVGFIHDEGIVRHEQLEKWLISFNDEFKIDKNVKIGVNLLASRTHYPYDATSRLDDARKAMPQVSAGTKPFKVLNPYGTDSITIPIYSRLDEALQNSGVVNPVLELENTWDKDINIEFRTVGSAYGEVNFLKYLTFRATLYADLSQVTRQTYTPLYYAYNPGNNDSVSLYSAKTSLLYHDNNYRKFQQDYILTFKKSFGDHNVTATGGFTTYYSGVFEHQVYVRQGSDASSLPIPNDKRFWYINSGFGVVDPAIDGSKTYSNQHEYTTVSFLGRVLYNYAGKYYLNASLRDDASSQIPEKNRHQNFWAVGGAWEITKENFFENQRILDFLKLKGSVGVLGNQTATDADGNPLPYPFYPGLRTGANAVFPPYTYIAAQPLYIPNPDLKWETVHAWEVGVELSAFANRLHFEANYFDRETHDLMTYVQRGSIGKADELINGGNLRNWGEEFAASWTQSLSKDLTLNVAGNITFLKNKVVSLSKELPTGVLIRSFNNNGSAESRTLPGYPIASFFGYEVEGLYQSYADILKSPVASSLGSYGPGDFKFKDVNGDGQITSSDRKVIGNPTPKFTYGGSINVGYKGISLSVDVNGVYGNQIFRTWGSLESPFQRVNYSGDKINRWHGPGTSNWVPIISQAHRFNYNGSTYNMEDGSYFRIRNIQLGYNFPKSLISKWKITNLRVFVNVQNVKTWKNNYGYTAEFGGQGFGGDATAFGYDNAGGAIPRISTAGINLTF